MEQLTAVNRNLQKDRVRDDEASFLMGTLKSLARLYDTYDHH